jgi:GMP synthase (glutamine-hydrolysing)
MCYGFQLMAQASAARSPDRRREYGRTPVDGHRAGTLLADVPASTRSGCRHGDSVVAAPEGFDVLASTAGTPVAAFEDLDRGWPASSGTPRCCTPSTASRCSSTSCSTSPAAGRPGRWSTSSRSRSSDPRARSATGRAICGLSGGVDSAVAAAIVQRAIGDRLDCVFVDHGLLRRGGGRAGRARLRRAHRRQPPRRRRAPTAFLDGPRGVTDPEEKRKIIGREFIRVVRRPPEADVLGAAADEGDKVAFLVQGTLYPTSSSPAAAPAPPTSSPTTTSAACPTTSSSSWSSRCARCSRTRSASSASSWACRPRSSGASRSPARPRHPDHRRGHPRAPRHPPRGRRDRPRGAHRAGLDRDIWQFPVVLLADVRSVGVQGDGRTYGHPSCCGRSPPRTR